MALSTEEEAMIIDMLAILRTTEEWMARDLTPAQPGSAFIEDDSRSAPFQVSHAVARTINAAVDHLHCLRMAMTGQGEGHIGLHTFGPFSLLRGAIENSALAIWMASPEDSNQRILRCLRHEMYSLDNEAAFISLSGDSDNEEIQDVLLHNAKLKKRLLEVADSCGTASISRGKVKKEPRPSYVVEEAGKYMAPTKKDEVLAPTLWRLCSGVAHGDAWPQHRLFSRERQSTISPGVSNVRLTAPTSLAHTATVTARLMIRIAMNLAHARSTA